MGSVDLHRQFACQASAALSVQHLAGRTHAALPPRQGTQTTPSGHFRKIRFIEDQHELPRKQALLATIRANAGMSLLPPRFHHGDSTTVIPPPGDKQREKSSA